MYFYEFNAFLIGLTLFSDFVTLLVFSVTPNCTLQNTQPNKLIPNFLSKQYLGENLGSLPGNYKYNNIYINLKTINSKNQARASKFWNNTETVFKRRILVKSNNINSLI